MQGSQSNTQSGAKVGRPVTGDDYDPNTYSRDKFYCAEAGSETIRARISTDLMRHIQEVVREPLFTHYVTISDFVCDAVMHHLQYRAEQVSDPGLKLSLQGRLENEWGQQEILMLDEQAKAEERVAAVIANRYWKATSREAKQKFYVEARKLRNSGILDDHLKDELNRVIANWVARVAEEDDRKLHGESHSDLI